jgi:hypothetical protein
MNILTREHVNRRLLGIVAIITAALLAIGIWLTFSLLRPTPPRSVAMAIDPEGSFSAELGKRYRELLARDGIDLRLVQFPAPESIELPLSIDARQFYKTESPFLQRHLPFWLAVLVQQVVALFIPVAGLLYPTKDIFVGCEPPGVQALL